MRSSFLFRPLCPLLVAALGALALPALATAQTPQTPPAQPPTAAPAEPTADDLLHQADQLLQAGKYRGPGVPVLMAKSKKERLLEELKQKKYASTLAEVEAALRAWNFVEGRTRGHGHPQD